MDMTLRYNLIFDNESFSTVYGYDMLRYIKMVPVYKSSGLLLHHIYRRLTTCSHNRI